MNTRKQILQGNSKANLRLNYFNNFYINLNIITFIIIWPDCILLNPSESYNL